MPYEYKAYTADGGLIRGTTDASSTASVEEMLWTGNYYIAQIEMAQPATTWRDMFPSFFGVKPREVIILTRQMATLIGSGIPLLRTLTVLRDQVTNPTLKDAMGKIVEDIETGSSVSAAFARFPLVFPGMYSRLVEVGERTGHLDQVLDQVATYMEKREAISTRVRGALSYPSFVLAIAVAVVGLLVNVALPSILGIFKEFGAELPWSTKTLLTITEFSQAYGQHLLFGILGVAVAVTYAIGRPGGKRRIGQLMLRLPLVGQIIIRSSVATISRSFAVLLQAGIPLTEVIDLTIAGVDNSVIRESLDRVRTRLLQGHGLAGPLSQEQLFPVLFSQMLRVGEETGSLEPILLTLSSFYEQETDRAISALTSKIEPALIIFVGGIIGFIALAVLTPMYSLLGSIG